MATRREISRLVRRLHLWLPVELHEAPRQPAADEHHPLNRQVVYLPERAVAAAEIWQPPISRPPVLISRMSKSAAPRQAVSTGARASAGGGAAGDQAAIVRTPHRRRRCLSTL